MKEDVHRSLSGAGSCKKSSKVLKQRWRFLTEVPRRSVEVLQVLERPLGTAWCSAALPTDVVLPAGAQAQQEATVPK